MSWVVNARVQYTELIEGSKIRRRGKSDYRSPNQCGYRTLKGGQPSKNQPRQCWLGFIILSPWAWHKGSHGLSWPLLRLATACCRAACVTFQASAVSDQRKVLALRTAFTLITLHPCLLDLICHKCSTHHSSCFCGFHRSRLEARFCFGCCNRRCYFSCTA